MDQIQTSTFHKITTPFRPSRHLPESSSLCFTVARFFQVINDKNFCRTETLERFLKNKKFVGLVKESNKVATKSKDLLENLYTFITSTKNPFPKEIKRRNYPMLDQLIDLQKIMHNSTSNEAKSRSLTDFFSKEENKELMEYICSLCKDFNLPTMVDFLDTKLFYNEVLKQIERKCIHEYVTSCEIALHSAYSCISEKEDQTEDLSAPPEPEEISEDLNLDQKINLYLARIVRRIPTDMLCSVAEIKANPCKEPHPEDDFHQLIHLLALVTEDEDRSELIRDKQDEIATENRLIPEVCSSSLLKIHAMARPHKSIFLQCLIMCVCKNKRLLDFEEYDTRPTDIENDLKKIKCLTFVYKTLVENDFSSEVIDWVGHDLFNSIDRILKDKPRYQYELFKTEHLESDRQSSGEKLHLVEAFLEKYSNDTKPTPPLKAIKPKRSQLGCCVQAVSDFNTLPAEIIDERYSEWILEIKESFKEKYEKASLDLFKEKIDTTLK